MKGDMLEEYKLIENNSKVYFNGSVWESNSCGNFEIVGRTDRFRIDNRGYKEFKYYLCKFTDGTIVEAKNAEIIIGKVKNQNHPVIRGIGYLGVGKWKPYIGRKATKEYALFKNIIERCYHEENNSYKYYGGVGVKLDEELHNFQVFCDMISQLPNYNKWKNDNDNVWNLDKDELCEKLNISPKIYARNTCKFMLEKDNMSERNKRVSVTGLTYVAISPSNAQYEFTNIKQFAREHNLYDTHIGNCIKGKAKQHKGWTFKVKE